MVTRTEQEAAAAAILKLLPIARRILNDDDALAMRLATAALVAAQKAKPIWDFNDTSLFARLEKKIIPEPNSGCWIWLGSTSAREGYGSIKYKDRHFLVHRIMWAIGTNGYIPPGIFICHSCDNPICCNPDHLFPGTPKQNTEDSMRKNRRPQNGAKKSLWEEKERTGDWSPSARTLRRRIESS